MRGYVDVKDQQSDTGITINLNPGFFIRVDGVIQKLFGYLVLVDQIFAFMRQGLKHADPIALFID